MSASKGSRSADVFIKKLSHVVSLVTMGVIVLGGLMAGVRVIKIAYRSCFAMLVIMVVTRIIIRVLSRYEEINIGKA